MNLGADMKLMMYCAALAALATSCDALAVGAIANVTIVDRDNGTTLEAHYFRGEYWVAGAPGARYAIEVRNDSGARLLAVTSVDGVNVLSGATAGWNQGGYVFDPGERYQITGWRKSDAEVAAFTFTAAPNSYAERTGRPANVGVIGVAVFRERPPPMSYAPPRIADSARERAAASQSTATAGMPADAMNAPAESSLSWRALAPAPKLGTGHGEREYSYVGHTEFRRLQPEPNEVIRIRYDSLDNLMAMGIVGRPRATPPVPNPFPGSRERNYVPDPPG
ncbi:MAG TPA: hypothetical protein VIE42_04030 [Steroidobacteraceae bacterium]|jgi:hypothetical protein